MPVIQNWSSSKIQDIPILALKFNNIILDDTHAEYLGQVKWGKKTISPEIEALRLLYDKDKVYKFYKVNSEILCTVRRIFSFRTLVGFHYAMAVGTSESHWFEYLGVLVNNRIMVSPEYNEPRTLLGDISF